MNFKKNY